MTISVPDSASDMPSPYPETPHGRLITAFFDRLDDANVAYVVLRNWETLPDEPVGDIDVVTADVGAAGRLLHAVADERQFVPIRVARHTWHRIHALAPRTALTGTQPVVVDIQPGVTHRRGISIPAARVLDQRLRAGSWWRPRPGTQAAAIMLHCAIDRRAMPDRYRKRVLECATADPERFISDLGSVTGQAVARRALEEPEGTLDVVSRSFRGQPVRALLLRATALRRYVDGPGPVVQVASGVERELQPRGVRVARSRIEARRRMGVVVSEGGDATVDDVLDVCRRLYT